MRTLYLFDFDGTLSEIDSSKHFYKSISNFFIFFLCYYVIPSIELTKYFFFQGDNFEIKKKRFYGFCMHCSRKKIDSFIAESDKHMDQILKNNSLDLIRKIRKDPNNDIFIVSASISILIEKWAKREGIGLIANNFDIRHNNKKRNITFLDNFDCDGIGKSLRIKREIELSKYDRIISFGDTPNDFHMFLLSDKFYYKSIDITHQ